MFFLSSILAISCQQPDPVLSTEWEDHQIYLEASLLPTDPALQKCLEISEEELKGECIWFIAKANTEKNSRAPQPERIRQAFKHCDLAPTDGWKTVCRFDAIDMTGVTGEVADAACAQTGEFQERCMIHALLREEDQLAARFPKGKEIEMMQSIQNRMTNIGLTEVSQEPIHETLTARVVARRFETAWRNNPNYVFSQSDCGGLSEAICVDAYRIAIKQIGKGRLPSPCSLPMTSERLTSASLPMWSEGLDGSIQGAWKSLCHATYGPQKAPDYASSQRAKNQSPFRQTPESQKSQPNRTQSRK